MLSAELGQKGNKAKGREREGNKGRKEMRRRKGKGEEGEFEGTGMNEGKRPCLPRTSRGEN